LSGRVITHVDVAPGDHRSESRERSFPESNFDPRRIHSGGNALRLFPARPSVNPNGPVPFANEAQETRLEIAADALRLVLADPEAHRRDRPLTLNRHMWRRDVRLALDAKNTEKPDVRQVSKVIRLAAHGSAREVKIMLRFAYRYKSQLRNPRIGIDNNPVLQSLS